MHSRSRETDVGGGEAAAHRQGQGLRRGRRRPELLERRPPGVIDGELVPGPDTSRGLAASGWAETTPSPN
jgi:hypothetical protein